MIPVTVVIPAYNAGAFLDQALASLAGQTTAPESVIVVDDGSSDGSGGRAERWTNRLPLRVLTHERNAGLFQARRTGIDAATTPLIALLDADDIWLPDHLETMHALYCREPGLITARALRWVPGEALGKVPMNGGALPLAHHQLERILLMNFVFVGSLFERALYAEVGGFRGGRNGAEDWDLWTRMLLAGARVRRPQHPTVLYRVHGASMSADDALLESELTVLRDLRNDVPADLLPSLETSIRHRLGRLALRAAYADARRGAPWAARWRARHALQGPRGVKLRALLLLVSPQLVVRRRDEVRADPAHVVKH